MHKVIKIKRQPTIILSPKKQRDVKLTKRNSQQWTQCVAHSVAQMKRVALRLTEKKCLTTSALAKTLNKFYKASLKVC